MSHAHACEHSAPARGTPIMVRHTGQALLRRVSACFFTPSCTRPRSVPALARKLAE
eukprot:CAMPEP_0119415236 /NCGR_PEP_ID=MMETSP1335-20130426/8330_1 /TAXON_ID=259385 /ORGANISM="Chrysoculter rhomboideus, Strain RCC1486" /LENGTH=55 /DNA_ID=CAMNT_0007440195 /DNA_START=518 /DNA_END=682 /DNA_ORIENTATION=+